MQLTERSRTAWGNRVIALGLVVFLVGSLFAGLSAAEPAMGFRGTDVSKTTVTVGENVTVTASVVNVGSSGGGYTFEFERNGTDFAEERIQVPANSERNVSRTVQFDRPGTYLITVNDNRAGYVTVRPARARVESVNDTQRRVDIRANGVSTTAPTDLDIPSSNRSVELSRWSTTTGQSSFQQNLTEYTNRSAVSTPLPESRLSTLLAVVEFESDDEFQRATMYFSVEDAAFENASLERDEVAVYQRNGTVWERLETARSTATGNRTAYEATATRGTAYALGRIDPDISIANTSVETTTTGSGDVVTLDAGLRNDGLVAGEFVGVMRVNGDEVNRTTVAVPAAANASITLSHRLTEPGTYNIRLNGSRSTQVIIRDTGTAVATPSTETPATSPSATPAAGGEDGGSGGGVPATVLGINTAYVLGGVAIALGAFVAILLLLRRGDTGGGSDSFDQL